MPDLYRDEILDHYKNPRNFGDLEEATVSFEESNPLCGDQIFLQIKIEKNKVTGVKFRGQGCAVSTASASLLTEHLKGSSLAELEKLQGSDVLALLGLENLSPARLKCAFLPLEALRHLLKEYHSAGRV